MSSVGQESGGVVKTAILVLVAVGNLITIVPAADPPASACSGTVVMLTSIR